MHKGLGYQKGYVSKAIFKQHTTCYLKKKKKKLWLMRWVFALESHINMVSNSLIRPYIFNSGLFIKTQLQKSPYVIFMNCDSLITILHQYHRCQNNMVKFMTQSYKNRQLWGRCPEFLRSSSFLDFLHNYKGQHLFSSKAQRILWIYWISVFIYILLWRWHL